MPHKENFEPLHTKTAVYYDPETGFPVGLEYRIFLADGQKVASLNERNLARRIVAAYNACKDLSTDSLEFAAEENMNLDFQNRVMNLRDEAERLRQENARLSSKLAALEHAHSKP